MAIFRCNKCGHLREVQNSYIGKSVTCPKCETPNPIYDSVSFIEKVLEKYFLQRKELQELRQQLTPSTSPDTLRSEQTLLTEVDIYNTTALATNQQFESILTWFRNRGIQIDINHSAIDTTGFFDEVAVKLGNSYELLKLVSDQIKYAQQKGLTNTSIHIAKQSQKDIQLITHFCKELYDYSFVAKYFYQNKEKIIRLTLQTVPKITSFFNGEWMEWFVFMKLLNFFQERKISATGLRNLSVIFSNEDVHELDVSAIPGPR